jgi:hypothetical protein
MANLLEADIIVLRGFPFLRFEVTCDVVGSYRAPEMVTKTRCMLGIGRLSSGLSTPFS